MKALIISPFFRPSIGGVETHLTDLTEYLSKKGHQVFVTTYMPNITGTYRDVGEKVRNPLAREVAKNLDVRRIKWFGHGLFFSLTPYLVLEWLYIVPALLCYTFFFLLVHRVEVINAHGLMAAFVARILTKIFRLKCVMSVHVVYNFKKRPLLRMVSLWIFSSFEKILTLSERSERDFIELPVRKDKLLIYTHWVDQTVFKPPVDRARLKEKYGFTNTFVVLFVGKFYETKIGNLLEAAKKLPSNIKIFLIGSGPLEMKLRRISKEIESVAYVGKVSLEQLVEYYGLADVFIIPSVSGYGHEEGFARVIVEALSCGTPVIVSRVGCLPDAVVPSVGRVVDPNPEAIYEQILYLYEHPSELSTMRQNCRSYALRRFSERNAELIENVLVEASKRA